MPGPGHLERDLGTGVARTHEQHRAVLQLRHVSVLARVQLGDAWIQLVREVRNTTTLIGRIATTTWFASNRCSPASTTYRSPSRLSRFTTVPVRTGNPK